MLCAYSSRRSDSERFHHRSGFALLVTITLVAFLVLVLVALATLTRVETQVASNSQQFDQARQNALMALNIAIGQLQKYAGPDQRVTTTADITADHDKADNPTPAPVFTTDSPRLHVQPGSRYWTGAWGNNQTNIRYNLRPNQIPPTSGNRRGVTPALLNWLVSGNEKAVFTNRGSAGGTYPGTDITFTPESIVDRPDPDNAPNDFRIAGTPAVLLVGANTVGSDTTAAQDYVVAPLVNITAPAGSVPGLGATDQPVIGKYAWWVGDEGVKARINLQNGYQKTSQASDEINSFIIAQSTTPEFMDVDISGSQKLGELLDYGDDTIIAQLPRVLLTDQLTYLGEDVVAQTDLQAAAQTRFHDITTTSFGVLSDTYAGGLKKDLTADIADTSENYTYRPANADHVFSPRNNAEDNLPNWGMIRDWARTQPDPISSEIAPSTPDESLGGVGIYPTIAYFSMGFTYYLNGSTPVMAFYPIISLHNPYPYAIEATDYDVGLRLGPTAKFTVEVDPDHFYELDDDGAVVYQPDPTGAMQQVVDGSGNPVFDGNGEPVLEPKLVPVENINYDEKIVFNLHTVTAHQPLDIASTRSSFIRLQLKGMRIPPGQRHLYVLPDNQHGREYNHGSPPTLERAPDTPGGLGESNYFTFTAPSIDLSDCTSQAHIRLAVRDNYNRDQGIKFADVSLTLAQENSLAGTTWIPDSGHNYQTVHGIYPTISHLIAFGQTMGAQSGKGFYCTTDALGDLIPAKQIPPSFADSAIRVATGYEGGGWWSSHWKMGFVHGYYPSRVVADGSLRAPHIMATWLENGSGSRPDGTSNRSINDSVGAGIFGARIADANADQGRDPHPGVSYYRYTTGIDGGPDTGGSPSYSILWDILDSPDKLLSLGQLQHVPFSLYDFQPSYLFGNSYANKRIPRNAIENTSKLRKLIEAPDASPLLPIYDTSWLLNRALWDKYFVSGVPATWSQTDVDDQKPLPNARMTPYSRQGSPSQLESLRYTGGTNRAYDEAAASLLVSGAFNINSTSEQAWRAILASTYRIPLNSDYANAGDQVETTIPYPRFTHNLAQAGDTVYPERSTTMKPSPTVSGPTDSQFGTKIRNTLYLGNRGLFLGVENDSIPENPDPQEIVAELARSIVNEIRQRGPFLSLSDFVNRPLTESSFAVPSNPVIGATPDPQKIAGIKGVLQAGLDNMNPEVAQVNPVTYQKKGTSGYKRGQAWPRYNWDSEHAVGGPIIDTSITFPAAEVYRSPFSMTPKMLTQADLLSTLGPMLSPRSDTFTIRAYGEKRNPITNDIEGRAWCEAVVQRTPDYVGGEVAETATTSLATASASKTFGRTFKVVSFRWLSPEDI